MTMSIKIYLIKHIDTGMGYVGITGDDLGKRWYQHLHDKNGALYTALRAEGHRMTMELIEEVYTREEALIKEQMYIRSIGTAQPAGWNRQVKTSVKKQNKIKSLPISYASSRTQRKWWYQKATYIKFADKEQLSCPVCGCENLHFTEALSFPHPLPKHIHVDGEYTYIGVYCEWCHGNDEWIEENEARPLYSIRFWYTHGTISIKMIVFIEDKS
jgi:predicted nucleic-acid-binding Zn-ribbon protein